MKKHLKLRAGEKRLSFGKSTWDLIRRGNRYQLTTRERNGIPVFEVPEDFPVTTGERVRELLNGD